MKTFLKYVRVFSLSLFTSLIISGCSTDGYSSGDFGIAWATVNEPNRSFTFDYNGGTTARVISSATDYVPKNKRVIINYSPMQDDYQGYDLAIALNYYVADVLTKDIFYVADDDEVAQDTLGISPIDILAADVGGGYLNMRIMTQNEAQSRHLLNLVSAEPDLGVNKDVVRLKFRHRADNMANNYHNAYAYFCIDLAPYRIAGRDKVTFIIENDYPIKGKKELTVEYKYTPPTEPEKPQPEEEN